MKDRGSAAVEYMATIGMFLIVVIACLEAYAAFLTIENVESATRTGARVASMASDPGGRSAEGRSAAEAAMPGWINEQTVTVSEVGVDSVQCTVRAKVPLLVKGIPFDVTVTRRVEMPVG
jgi:hypothetical protein